MFLIWIMNVQIISVEHPNEREDEENEEGEEKCGKMRRERRKRGQPFKVKRINVNEAHLIAAKYVLPD